MRALPKIQILVFLFCFPVLIAQVQTTIGKMPDMDIRLLDGKKTTMYKLLDSGPILIDFWATWCKPCKQVMVHLNRFHSKYKDTGLRVLMINQDTPRSLGKVKSYINSKEYQFLVCIDPNQQIAKKLNGQIMPNLLLVDQDRSIKWRHQGYMAGEEREIEEQIKILLAAQ